MQKNIKKKHRRAPRATTVLDRSRYCVYCCTLQGIKCHEECCDSHEHYNYKIKKRNSVTKVSLYIYSFFLYIKKTLLYRYVYWNSLTVTDR